MVCYVTVIDNDDLHSQDDSVLRCPSSLNGDSVSCGRGSDEEEEGGPRDFGRLRHEGHGRVRRQGREETRVTEWGNECIKSESDQLKCC